MGYKRHPLAYLLAVLWLSGCATKSVQVNLSPATAASSNPVQATISNESATTSPKAILRIFDERTNEQQLGRNVLVEDSSFPEFVADIFSREYHDCRVLIGNEHTDDTRKDSVREIRVVILKAYVNHILSNIEAVAVVRCQEISSGHHPELIFRGQEVNVNWWNAGSEYRKVLQQCIEQIAPQIRKSYNW